MHPHTKQDLLSTAAASVFVALVIGVLLFAIVALYSGGLRDGKRDVRRHVFDECAKTRLVAECEKYATEVTGVE